MVEVPVQIFSACLLACQLKVYWIENRSLVFVQASFVGGFEFLFAHQASQGADDAESLAMGDDIVVIEGYIFHLLRKAVHPAVQVIPDSLDVPLHHVAFMLDPVSLGLHEGAVGIDSQADHQPKGIRSFQHMLHPILVAYFMRGDELPVGLGGTVHLPLPVDAHDGRGGRIPPGRMRKPSGNDVQYFVRIEAQPIPVEPDDLDSRLV
ncbi:MAG: hypothetical protein BWY82_02057 [Verrucomicrobia bacterium ADurb.Bin474]|nr:MAG: hypothetical protein BWY82_02057 [Verrucomicrobia bacterium ADurb.Bin474]